MTTLTTIQWDVPAAIELQEHLEELPDTQARVRLLTEAYECGRSFAEQYCDTLRNVHPERLVGILNHAELHRPTHEEALLLIKAITYSDKTGDVAVGFLPREAA